METTETESSNLFITEAEESMSDSISEQSHHSASDYQKTKSPKGLDAPQDSFVTDGKSKTKWNEAGGRLVERVETTLDANSLAGHIGESLSAFCNDPLFSDVLIRIGVNAYDAHRVVLAAQSSFFRNLLAERPLNSKGKIDLEIEVSSHSSAEQFPNMLRYLYGGGLTLNKDTGIIVLYRAPLILIIFISAGITDTSG